MKTFLIAAVAALGLTTTAAMASGAGQPVQDSVVVAPAAMQDNWAIVGSAEWALEARAFEGRVGVEYSVDAWTFTPTLVTTYDSVNSFDFAGMELRAEYEFTAGMSAYGMVELDNNFDYAETTLGIAFRF